MQVRDGNQHTVDTIQQFKKSVASDWDGPVASSFIRRRLALLLCEQKHPDLVELHNEVLDQLVRSLRAQDREHNQPGSDEIYIECLIRANLDLEQAIVILRDQRPNLVGED